MDWTNLEYFKHESENFTVKFTHRRKNEAGQYELGYHISTFGPTTELPEDMPEKEKAIIAAARIGYVEPEE